MNLTDGVESYRESKQRKGPVQVRRALGRLISVPRNYLVLQD